MANPLINSGDAVLVVYKRSRTLLLPYLIWNLLPMMNIVAGNLFSIILGEKVPRHCKRISQNY